MLSQATDVELHLARFAAIATQLPGCTLRVAVSVLDFYRKTAGWSDG